LNELKVKIWRGTETGKFFEYQVPVRENQTVLDVVTYVKPELDAGVAYRFACRVGVCGSCAMTVNGKPRWTCRSHVKDVVKGDRLKIEPLRSHPRIKDLVVDLQPFLQTWNKAGAVFEPIASRADAIQQLPPDSKQRAVASAGIECINCAVCYSACDAVAWNKKYLGPAALNRAWTLVNDVKHHTRDNTLDQSLSEGGCHACHSMGNCTRH